ncbi:uncharacterized protein LOC127787101 [Diospyros lotus]|uniref:uncharacterized protein LOC127787101 n=1 Tax=Diospyros lotus TaxID=55363 RepID=UPI00224D8397|nr:uncharacterized protein LOC127787101 [Diospyros lotus]
MLNYSHKHDFNLKVSRSRHDICAICWNTLGRGLEAYSCSGCDFWMDKSCVKLQPEIRHPFHPQHPLRLLPKAPHNYTEYLCAACGVRQTKTSYHCSNCDFSLDLRCASLQPPKTTTTSRIIQPIINSIHPHPLIPCSSSSPYNFDCSYCWLPLEGTFLVCLHCHLFLHQSCFEFPKEISHSHPIDQHHHPFTFQRDSGNTCNFCDQRITKGFSFQCRKCHIFLDFRCGSLKPTKISHDLELRVQDFNHPHPFIAFENPMNFPFSCHLCELPIIKETIFACFECKLIMHISCALLPREIKRHPFHPQHPIKLRDGTTPSRFFEFKCWLCRNSNEINRGEFQYLCLDCKFAIHSRCALPVPPVVKIQTHNHPLALLTSEKSKLYYFKCDSCRGRCGSAFFRCVSCELFALHVACIPNLPPIAKDVRHRHPLRLTFSRIQDRIGEDDWDEFYCDSCEESRDLDDPIYYCAECQYVAHIHCLASEVMRFLQEKEQEEDNASMEEADQKEITQKADLESKEDNSPTEEVEKEITELRWEINELEAKLAVLKKEVKELETKLPMLRKEEQTLLAQLKLVTDKLAAFLER